MNIVKIAILTILILLFVILVLTNKSENFDVYNNHTFGAEDVYNEELLKDPKNTGGGKIDFKSAKLLSKYTWSDKDPLGMNVYDKYYEAVVNEKNYGDETPRKTGYTAPYDTKFEIQPFNPPANIGSYNLRDMYDHDPVYMTFMGEPIVLAQANY